MTRLARLLALASMLAACGDDDDDDDHTSDIPSCQAIIDACHLVDDGSRMDIATCHDQAHDVMDRAYCDANQTRCVELCNAAAGDGGGGDAGHDAHDADDQDADDGADHAPLADMQYQVRCQRQDGCSDSPDHTFTKHDGEDGFEVDCDAEVSSTQRVVDIHVASPDGWAITLNDLTLPLTGSALRPTTMGTVEVVEDDVTFGGPFSGDAPSAAIPCRVDNTSVAGDEITLFLLCADVAATTDVAQKRDVTAPMAPIMTNPDGCSPASPPCEIDAPPAQLRIAGCHGL